MHHVFRKTGFSPPFVNIPSRRTDQDREAQLAALDAAVNRALTDSDAGEGKPANQVFDRLDAKYRALANAAWRKSK